MDLTSQFIVYLILIKFIPFIFNLLFKVIIVILAISCDESSRMFYIEEKNILHNETHLNVKKYTLS